MKPNYNFHLSVNDISLIEDALKLLMKHHPDQCHEINELLGSLWNQKTLYKPKKHKYAHLGG